MTRPTRRLRTAVAACAVAALGVQALPAAAAPSAVPVRTAAAVLPVVAPAAVHSATPRLPGAVAPSFFGVHDFSPIGRNGWPLTAVGSIRLWDVGVTWRDIEKRKNVYDFTRLDTITREAKLRGADVLIVLGQTPRFYASKVRSTDVYGPGAASMPTNLNAWKRYIQAVANRPNIRNNPRVQFQVWNEANVTEFWTGSQAQMALLTKLTRDALTPTKTSRYLLAPALVTRATFQRTWMDRFYAQKVNGRPVADYVNAVSLQLYPLPTGSPEDSMSILAQDKKILAKYRVRKPIWNTEINYGLSGPHNVAPLSASRQAANVSRTLVLNANADVKRVFWYAWGNTTIANTRTTGPNGFSLTLAGKSFGVTRSWLVGAQARGCSRSSSGTYTCTFRYARGVRRVYWNPNRTVTLSIPNATTDQLVDGTTHRYRSRTLRLRVGAVPVMVVSAR